jgi:hypothetical protein
MVPAPFIVVLDANVLFPFTLRDTLLRAAAAGFYQLRWTSLILDEMARNLVSTGTMGVCDGRMNRLGERQSPLGQVREQLSVQLPEHGLHRVLTVFS